MMGFDSNLKEEPVQAHANGEDAPGIHRDPRMFGPGSINTGFVWAKTDFRYSTVEKKESAK
jgi:hypothetical protein